MKVLFLVFAIYLLAVNTWGFIQMYIDKRRAERNFWRISEFSLFIPAILGGAVGCLLGMHICHHKTRHIKFMVGMPFILLVHVGIVVFLLFFSPFKFIFI